MTYFGGEVVPTAQPVGFDGWPAMQGSPTAFTAPIQPFQSGQPGSAAPLGLAGPGGSSLGWTWPRPLGVGQVPVEPLRQQAAALLQRCYHWLDAAVPIVPQVSWLVPALVTAVQQYEAQQYEACLAQTLAVIQTMRQVQAAVPTLPAL